MTAVFAFPTTILFGPGSVAELPERLARIGATKPLVTLFPPAAKSFPKCN
jgi:alcohol dehydrogenase class IV